MGMAAGSMVKDFDVIEDVGARQITGFVDAFSHALLFQTAEEGLGNRIIPTQFPRRLMLGSSECERQNRCQSSLPYCEP